MVGVSASVNLPLLHKVQKFSSGAGSPGWSRKKGRKTIVVVVTSVIVINKSVDIISVGVECYSFTGSYIDLIRCAVYLLYIVRGLPRERQPVYEG